MGFAQHGGTPRRREMAETTAPPFQCDYQRSLDSPSRAFFGGVIQSYSDLVETGSRKSGLGNHSANFAKNASVDFLGTRGRVISAARLLEDSGAAFLGHAGGDFGSWGGCRGPEPGVAG